MLKKTLKDNSGMWNVIEENSFLISNCVKKVIILDWVIKYLNKSYVKSIRLIVFSLGLLSMTIYLKM